MPKMTVDEAKAVVAKLRTEREANYKMLEELEQPYRAMKARASEIYSQAQALQNDHLDAIGLGYDEKGHGANPAFLAKLAAHVGSTPEAISTLLPKSNSRYGSSLAAIIFDRVRHATPPTPEVVALGKQAEEVGLEAVRVEQAVRSSVAYRENRDEGRRIDWAIRQANEDVDRLQKNEEARDSKRDVAERPDLKEIARVRARLNAIADDKESFTFP